MEMSYSLRAGPVVRRVGAGGPHGVHPLGWRLGLARKIGGKSTSMEEGMSEAGDVEGGSWGSSVAPGEQGALVNYYKRGGAVPRWGIHISNKLKFLLKWSRVTARSRLAQPLLRDTWHKN